MKREGRDDRNLIKFVQNIFHTVTIRKINNISKVVVVDIMVNS